MKNYIFKTTATMKPHNRKNWWIDAGIIQEIRIAAETVKEALKQYQEDVKEKHYIEISDNALKTKSAMYVDDADGNAKQVGYVITAKTEFEDRSAYKWSTQYIDLWVTIITTTETDFVA